MKNETPVTPSGTFTVRPEHMTREEFRIISGIVRRAISKGYTVSVYDGGEFTVKRSRDPAEIIGALATTEQDALVLRDADGRKVGTISLVYNGDDTVVADHTDNDETADLI